MSACVDYDPMAFIRDHTPHPEDTQPPCNRDSMFEQGLNLVGVCHVVQAVSMPSASSYGPFGLQASQNCVRCGCCARASEAQDSSNNVLC